MNFNQYDVVFFDPEPSKGHEVKKIRPCVILSPDDLNTYLATVIIAPLTSKIRNYAYRPLIKAGTISGELMLDQIRGVDKSRLKQKTGTLSLDQIRVVKSLLKEMLVD